MNTTNTDRKTAIIVGVLFIIATAFLFIGQAFYKPILSSPDYLEITYPNRNVVIIGILLEFVCVLAIPLISIAFFPILKRHNESLAVGYVVFRSFEALILTGVAEINKLSLIGISEAYITNGGADASHLEYVSSVIQAQNYWGDAGGLIYNIVFVIGALILYTVLYQSKLIPQWLSGWGFLSALAILTGTILSISFTLSIGIALLLVMPIAVQEMVMAVWLIVKGFNPTAVESETGAPEMVMRTSNA